MSIEAMKLALAALETCRIRSVSEWSVEDITPKNVTAAIAALRTAIQQAEASAALQAICEIADNNNPASVMHDDPRKALEQIELLALGVPRTPTAPTPEA